MSSLPESASRFLARPFEKPARTGRMWRELSRVAVALGLLALVPSAALAAKPTFGLALGIGSDMPDVKLRPTDCPAPGGERGEKPARTAEGQSAATPWPDCGWSPLPVGRLRVPIAFAVSERAAFVLQPGVDAGMIQSRVSWRRRPVEDCTVGSADCVGPGSSFYDYTGHFGVMVVPSLSAGVRVSGRLSDTLSLVGGANASIGYLWMMQSIGENTPGKEHGVTGEPLHGGTDGTHCFDKPLPAGEEYTCQFDLVKDGIRPGAELAIGVEVQGDRPVYVGLSYGVVGMLNGVPKHYGDAVRVKYQMLNPLMVTVGTTFGG